MNGTLEERFWAKVDRWDPDECWEWSAARNSGGYGVIYSGPGERRMLPAHRVAYELLVGPIPDGLQIDHLCRNRGCANPKHMEPVTGRENSLRGISVFAINARKTHCKRGHPFDEGNTWTYRGQRKCRMCKRVRRELARRQYPPLEPVPTESLFGASA